VDIDDLDERPARALGTLLVSHGSAPLSTLAATMMKLSQNLYAETLFKAAGGAGAVERNPGVATAASGREVVAKALEQWGIPREEVVVADGSGLSRYNLITPRALITILTHVDRTERLKAPFEAALPVAGVDGTLGARLRGTPAEKKVRAKTGAFSNARALSGYVTAASGEPLAFVLLANNFGVPAEAIERAMDAIVVKLAQFKR
jgi:D-alanyl-D-alanine carboxypeptidase/D-alanyl-D-alanine-endopeptidase (penicillin-binding protein 4)